MADVEDPGQQAQDDQTSNPVFEQESGAAGTEAAGQKQVAADAMGLHFKVAGLFGVRMQPPGEELGGPRLKLVRLLGMLGMILGWAVLAYFGGTWEQFFPDKSYRMTFGIFFMTFGILLPAAFAPLYRMSDRGVLAAIGSTEVSEATF